MSPSLVQRAARSLNEGRLLVLVALLYITAFPYHPGLRSPNELCRLWQTRALVEFGSLDVNEALRAYGPVGDLSVKDGRFFPSKAPLLSFLAVPVYGVLKLWGGGGRHAVPEVPQVFWSRLFLTVLPTLMLLVLLRRFLRTYVSRPVADGVTATYALGSLALSYSLLFMSHQTTAVLLFSSFYALWRCGRGDWREHGYLIAGAAAGAAVAAEYTAALGVGGLLVYAVYRALAVHEGWNPRLRRLGRAAGLATLGTLPFGLFLMAYHQASFGHPLESGYQHLADAGYQPWHLGGFLGIRYPDPRAFALSFFSPLRGLFALAPFLFLAVPGLELMRRSSRRLPAKPAEGALDLRALFWLSAALLAGYAYFTSAFSYDSWGWTTGPRHMTPLVPFLLLPAALLIERLRAATTRENRLGLGVLAGSCTISIVVTGAVSLVNYIPDSVSNALFGLAVPLFEDGYLPPSALALFGIPNPWSGAPLLIGLAVAAAWVGLKLIRDERPGRVREWVPSVLGAAITLGVYLGLMASVTRHDEGDKGAQDHLRSVWIAPAGKAIDFWPPPH